MTRPELWLCRHGETEWSRTGRHTSSTDLDLSDAGVDVARLVGKRLRAEQFDVVLTSPLRRARRTAELAGFPDADIDPDAVEWAYGDYEGRTTPEIRDDVPGWTIWRGTVPGGESPAEVAARADRLVERVRREAPERALLFAHGHFLRVLGARWLGLPPERGEQLKLDTATLSVLGWEREAPAIVRWNWPP
ncbi:MAG TPA: histidine phosphatase family protein [Acidimicrobiales bacterium]|nr:histidine phosphatase family protein [Acidimicrobiales bacterium]